MIKNIYDQKNKEYYHKYYCDNCFVNIVFWWNIKKWKSNERIEIWFMFCVL